MNEEEIRKIVRDEIHKNNSSGSPYTPRHDHTATNGQRLDPVDLIGFQPLPSSNVKILNVETGLYEYGFTAPKSVGQPSGLTQSVVNNTNAVYPFPYVLGFGVGVFSAFNGGAASDGTLTAFSNAGTTGQLWIRLEGKWYGVNLPLTA